jgi:hypothetical protein
VLREREPAYYKGVAQFMKTTESVPTSPSTASSTQSEAAARFGRPAGTWRLRAYTIIFEADTRAGRLFDLVLLVTILASVVVVILDSVQAITARYGKLFVTGDAALLKLASGSFRPWRTRHLRADQAGRRGRPARDSRRGIGRDDPTVRIARSNAVFSAGSAGSRSRPTRSR